MTVRGSHRTPPGPMRSSFLCARSHAMQVGTIAHIKSRALRRASSSLCVPQVRVTPVTCAALEVVAYDAVMNRLRPLGSSAVSRLRGRTGRRPGGTEALNSSHTDGTCQARAWSPRRAERPARARLGPRSAPPRAGGSQGAAESPRAGVWLAVWGRDLGGDGGTLARAWVGRRKARLPGFGGRAFAVCCGPGGVCWV